MARKAAQADTSMTALGDILEALYAAQFSQPALDSLRGQFPPDTARAAYYAAVRTRLLAAQPVEAGRLESLGRERGNAIAAVLLARGHLDSTRVAVPDPAPVKRKKAGSSRVPSEMSMDAE